MNYQNIKLYEEGLEVAKAERLYVAESQGSLRYILENVTIEPIFHLINTKENKYLLNFTNQNTNYQVDLIIDDRSTVSDDYKFIGRIEGVFTSKIKEL